MIVRFDEIMPDNITAPRNGKGTADSFPYAAMKGLNGKFKSFNMMILDPDSAIGYHKHETDMEAYLILDGEGIYNDNGTEVKVEAGDLAICNKGESHGLASNSQDQLTFLAFIME